MSTPLPTSDHFLLEAVADGIYAAIAVPGTGTMGNAVIIDIGDQTVIFDTMLTPGAARDLRAAAETLPGRPATMIVNSHWHGDHVQGNQIFLPDATIIATTITRDLMATRGAADLERYAQAAPQALAEAEQQLAEATDEPSRTAARTQIGDYRALLAGLPDLHLCLPTTTFTDRQIIQGTRRRMEIITLGGGHTASDAFAWLPDDGIMIAGDLLFVREHPWMGDGDPTAWINILTQMEQYPAQAIIPGHGPVGTLHDCAILRDYLHTIQLLVSSAHANNVPLEDVRQLQMPAPFDDWAGAELVEWDVEFLWKRLAPAANG